MLSCYVKIVILTITIIPCSNLIYFHHPQFSVKIDNLYYKTTIDILKENFSKFGDIGDVHIPRDRLVEHVHVFLNYIKV